MPSLRHQLLAHGVPLVRRSREVVDEEQTRREVLAAQDRGDSPPPARLRRELQVVELHPGELGFPVHDIRPADLDDRARRGPGRTILYLHGGGYIAGIDRNHWRYVSGLTRATGARVVLPSYPLAPRATWRDAQPPLLRLFEQLAVESPGGVTIAGDSAGGGLALAVAQQVAASPGPQPTGLLLIAPWVDLTGSTPGTEEMRGQDPWLKLSRMHLYGRWWAGEDDPDRPEGSPLRGSFAGLPPMLVFCGTRDLLLPQVRAMVRRAEEAGVQVRYEEGPGLIHVYPILPVPEARPAHELAVEFLLTDR